MNAFARIGRLLPPELLVWMHRLRVPRMAHLPIRRVDPVSRQWGTDRGKPIDRYFIEQFVERNSDCIRGDCLEVRDSRYTKRFGGDGPTRIDVLDIDATTQATIIGDLQKLPEVPDNTFDCFIATQVLQYIPDVPAAIAETFRILKPGGTALISVPFVASLDHSGFSSDFWRFTPIALGTLLRQSFPKDHVTIESFGNALVGTAFWIGLAQEDLRRRHLEHNDPQFPIVVTARATKPRWPTPDE